MIMRRLREVLVVHVLPVLPLMPNGFVAPNVYDQLERAQRASGKTQLDRLVQAARAMGVAASGRLLEPGGPADRIVRIARSRRADVIVMGTHGRTGITRAVIGSVAARVIAAAPCPVITVRA
jgi:nucleotide-binding universal stress UspA family protein